MNTIAKLFATRAFEALDRRFDAHRWMDRIRNHSDGGIFWNASAGFDLSPAIHAWRGALPEVVGATGPAFFYVMSDYGRGKIQAMGRLAKFAPPADPTTLAWLSTVAPPGWQVRVSDLVALRCFDRAALERVRAEHPHVNRNATPQSVPHDEWHATLFDVEATHGGSSLRFPVLFLHVCNTIAWDELFVPARVGVQAFCATWVAGKSGSWDDLHRPGQSALLERMRRSDPALRPQVWLSTFADELAQVWPPERSVTWVAGTAPWTHPFQVDLHRCRWDLLPASDSLDPNDQRLRGFLP